MSKANDVFAKLGLSQEEAIDLFLERTATLGEMPFPIQDELGGSYRSLAMALSGNYEEVYYVDCSSDHYVKFYGKPGSHILSEKVHGENFFSIMHDVVQLRVHPLDAPYISRLFDKNYLSQELGKDGTLSASYRSRENGRVEYHRIRFVRIADSDVNQIVIGVLNEDDQVRREKELRSRIQSVKDKARLDRLTGAYNKNAFEEARRRMNRKIKAGNAQFALVVCDLNNLKVVNDEVGHLAGDAFLKEGAQRLMKAFSPAKVYRFGGDEFAVILEGAVYKNRDYLVSSLLRQAFKAKEANQHVVALGVADFDAASDRDFSSVFWRADMAMYENKKKLKGEWIPRSEQ